MFEKVNPSHPDKLADRIAGAIVDTAYAKERNPRIAVEVLIGHGICHIITETSVHIGAATARNIVTRIAGKLKVDYKEHKQDPHLSANQHGEIKCGDNGIFKGVPETEEQKILRTVVTDLYRKFPTDGKYILSDGKLIACQSCVNSEYLEQLIRQAYTDNVVVNPLGDWTGGTDVDTGATNRKLGSDMADSVTGGGLHGKDLSKADVSVNIYAFLKARETNAPVEMCCAIGDTEINGIPYSGIVETARKYIESIGGFEKFAEWGFIR